MISISKVVLKEELTLAQRILNKWQLRLDEGIPVVDLPADGDQFDSFIREMVGELMLIAGKMESIASIISEDRSSDG